MLKIMPEKTLSLLYTINYILICEFGTFRNSWTPTPWHTETPSGLTVFQMVWSISSSTVFFLVTFVEVGGILLIRIFSFHYRTQILCEKRKFCSVWIHLWTNLVLNQISFYQSTHVWFSERSDLNGSNIVLFGVSWVYSGFDEGDQNYPVSQPLIEASSVKRK